MKRPWRNGAGTGSFLWRSSGVVLGIFLSAGALGLGFWMLTGLFPEETPASQEDRQQERIYLHYLNRICSRADPTHPAGSDPACRAHFAGRTSR